MLRNDLSLRALADNGSITWWDYKTGLPFGTAQEISQPGSLDAEAGIFCSTFDRTGSRLITGGADKTIKVRERVKSLCSLDADVCCTMFVSLQVYGEVTA